MRDERWDATRVGSMSVLAASVLWGTTGVAATYVPQLGPLVIAAVTMGIGGLVQALSAARQVRAAVPALRCHSRLVLLGAGAVTVYPVAFYSSMRLAGVAIGAVVSLGSAPLVSGMIESVVDGRVLTRRWRIGAGLGIGGAALLSVAGTAGAAPGASSSGLARTLLGALLGLLAGATYALYSWASHRLMARGVASRAVMGAVFGLGGLALVPVLLHSAGALAASWSTAAVVAYLALGPMWIGYLLFGWGLARIPASTATALSLLEPAVAAALAVLVVGERLTAAGWAAMGTVLVGLAVLTGPPSRSQPDPASAVAERAEAAG